MRKFIAAMLIAMLLMGSAAMAAGHKIEPGDFVRFHYSMDIYYEPNKNMVTGTIVSSNSICYVEKVDDKWALVRLSGYGEEGNFKRKGWGMYWGGWVKLKGLVYEPNASALRVVYLQGGFGNGLTVTDEPVPGEVRKDPSNKNHVKATASVWLHRTYGLSRNYGKALKKGQKVKYLHVIGIDKRGVDFYKVRYEGKCLWVSSKYSKRVK